MNNFWTKEWFKLTILVIIILVIIYILILVNRNKNKILINTNDIQIVAKKINTNTSSYRVTNGNAPLKKNWNLN